MKSGTLCQTTEFVYVYEIPSAFAPQRVFVRKSEFVVALGETDSTTNNTYEKILTPYGVFWICQYWLEVSRFVE